MTRSTPFRFGVQASTAAERPSGSHSPAEPKARLQHPDHARSFRRPVRPRTGPDGRRRSHHHSSGRRVGLGQRLQASGRVGQGTGDHRRAVRTGASRSGSAPAGWRATTSKRAFRLDSNKIRVDRFEEGLAVIKGAMSGEAFSLTGQHYTITDFDGTPTTCAGAVPPVADRWRRQAGVVDCCPRSRHRRY